MAGWEKILLGILAVVVLFWFLPGTRRQLAESPKGSREDWRGLIFILLLVVLFVMLLISLV